MKKNIFLIHKPELGHENFEIVERKGKGHPDTLSDSLAERLSNAYSKYSLKHFGAVLHHNFDKVGMMGGKCHVEFGRGKMLSPIRVLLNGRASTKFGNEKIEVKEMLINELTEQNKILQEKLSKTQNNLLKTNQRITIKDLPLDLKTNKLNSLKSFIQSLLTAETQKKPQ